MESQNDWARTQDSWDRPIDWSPMTSQQCAAVLWDMDGTLIDSEPLWLAAELAMLSRYGLEMSPQLHDRLVGSGLWDAAELFRELGVDMPANDIVAEWVDSVTSGLRTGPLAWRPGARELLESLREAGVPCALVTMSVRSLADQVVSQLPAGTFAAIIAGDEVEHEKPHPEAYERGAEALNVPITACIALEDSPTGVTAAVAAGAVTIGIEYLVSLAVVPAHVRTTTLTGVDAVRLQQLYTELRPKSVHAHTHTTSLTGELA